MSISEKIKAINNKIEQRKAQYNLHRETAKISALFLTFPLYLSFYHQSFLQMIPIYFILTITLKFCLKMQTMN